MSRKVDYAVNALCFMAQNGSFAMVSDLRRRLGMPPFFIREIMRLLSRAGILTSIRGKKGGFKFALHPSKINILMLMEVFDGVKLADNCKFRKKDCPRKAGCRLRGKLLNIEKMFSEHLREIDIESLMVSGGR